MQYTEIFYAVKIEKFICKNSDLFNNFALNMNYGYTLEPPRRGGSNEYQQSMFWIKKTKTGIPCKPQVFFYIKVGFQGIYISRTCFPDERHSEHCYRT